MAPHGSLLRPAHDVDPEGELIVRANHGDPHARHELILRHQRAVGELLQRMLQGSGRSSYVEDLAQETFLLAFKALSRFDPDESARLSTWLLTTATRLALRARVQSSCGTTAGISN
ncbi:MAG: sigma factor [Myxococcota bacterium]